MGEVLAKDYNSYKYLVESIRRFPNQVFYSNYKKTICSKVTIGNEMLDVFEKKE